MKLSTSVHTWHSPYRNKQNLILAPHPLVEMPAYWFSHCASCVYCGQNDVSTGEKVDVHIKLDVHTKYGKRGR